MSVVGTGVILGSALFGLFLGVAAVFGTLLALALALARNRSLVLMVALVLGLAAPLHKTVGPALDFTVRSGAPGLLISLTMLLLAVLYVAWMIEGTFKRDVARALRRPVFWMPLVALLLSSFSIYRAPDDYLAISQVVYMLIVYALFLYFGARVRTRTEVLWIAGSIGAIALIEAPFVILQKFTGGVFGVSLLAVSTQLSRDTDLGEVGRPAGTMIHPVFLAIVLSMIALGALSLALFHTNKRLRVAGLATVPICLVQIYLSSSRGPLIGLVVAMVALIAIGAAQHRISVRMWVTGISVGAVALFALSPLIAQFYQATLGEKQFDVEIQARLQLNEVGWRMIQDSPIVGIGLNNFMQVQNKYIAEPLLFPTFPSHNLFILTAAETGLVGLAGLLAIGVSLAWNAIRLGLRRDPLGRAMGWGMLSILILNLVAEQFSYSLRIEVPLTLFWLFAGLMMACLRIQEDETRARRAARHESPPPPSAPPTRPRRRELVRA